MKKRCTNSSCRRAFSYQADPLQFCLAPVSCPYCGKAYPRVMPAGKAHFIKDVQTGRLISLAPFEAYLREEYKVRAVRYLKTELGLGLLEAKIFMDQVLKSEKYPKSFTDMNGKHFVIL